MHNHSLARDRRIYTADGLTAFWIDALWLVPGDTYDNWRTWYGRVHKHITWTCFERGQLLVIAPSATGDHELSGQPCLFVKGPGRSPKGNYGHNSTVFCRYDGYQEISTCRLVPIEICTPVLDPNMRWLARMQLTEVPKRDDVWSLSEMGIISPHLVQG